ncbi:hypothetical protein SPB21_21595 [Leptothoe sp. ISB3NOV94-8A]|nr:hypothetical protein [Adonisia turfae]
MNQNNMAENVSPLPSQVEDVIQQCKKVLEQHYQQRLTDVFLYGSAAP